MTHTATQTSSPTRRSVATGVAWSLPVITATAPAPAFAVSPQCSTCVIPVASVSATTMTGSPPAPGTVSMASGFTFNVTACTGLISAQGVTLTSAVLTMSDGASYTTTAGLGLGAGVLGQVVTTGAVQWSGVTLPEGEYDGIANIGDLPVEPTSVCFTVNYFLLIGGIPGPCSQVVCFTPTLLSASVGDLPGAVVLATTWL